MPNHRVLWASALLAAACSPPGEPSSGPQQPPKIVFHQTTYDFGHADQGTKLTHVYTFHNAGGLDLVVDNVRTSCDCAAAVTAARVIPSRSVGSIEATFDTTNDLGRETRTITVYSNDPAQPVTTLTMLADVDADVAADPPQLYVGHVARGQAAPNEVRLVIANTAAVAVGPIETNGKVVEASVLDAAPLSKGKRLRVTIRPDAPPGRFKEAVRVRTSSRRRPVLTIGVTGIVDRDAPTPVQETQQ